MLKLSRPPAAGAPAAGRLGKWVAGDSESYRYLAESIRRHPDADTLLKMLQETGLEGCRYHSLAGGIVAVHRGYRS